MAKILIVILYGDLENIYTVKPDIYSPGYYGAGI